MTSFPLIVIGTSAGGMPALTMLLAQLPASFPAAILIVQHFSPDSQGIPLVQRLTRATPLLCHLAEHQSPIAAGNVYLAPPDRHLLVRGNHLLVTKGPHENSYRPAADALFRSAAVYHGPNVTGIVLTGMLHDGTAGLEFVQRCGGTTVVQAPTDAQFPSMPESALRNVEIDYVVPLAEMGALLQQLAARPTQQHYSVPDDLTTEATIAERVMGSTDLVSGLGTQVPFTCPDCGGSLWEMSQGQVPRYRCHVGHAFTADGLLRLQRDNMEDTLWVAIRMLEERKNLLMNISAGSQSNDSDASQDERIVALKRHINRLREFLLNGRLGQTG